MKKLTLTLAVVLFIGVVGYFLYQWYLPSLVAEMIVEEDTKVPVPSQLKTKISKIRKPVNEGATAMVTTMKNSGISMDQIFKAIDDAQEEQAYAMLDELNNTKIVSTDQVFDIAKKHFPVDFDVEVFRKTFNQKVSMRLVKKGIKYANIYRRDERIEPSTAKSIAKKILLQKQDELNKILSSKQ